MMRADACLHTDQRRLHIGDPRFHLATRPLLSQHDGTALIETYDVERVLANVDAGDRTVKSFCHGVLLVSGAPHKHHLLAEREHGLTIPLMDISGAASEPARPSDFA